MLIGPEGHARPSGGASFPFVYSLPWTKFREATLGDACSVCGLRRGLCLTCPRQAQAAQVLGWRLYKSSLWRLCSLTAFRPLSGRASLVDCGCLLACSYYCVAALYLQRPVSYARSLRISRFWLSSRSLSSCTVHVIFDLSNPKQHRGQ